MKFRTNIICIKCHNTQKEFFDLSKLQAEDVAKAVDGLFKGRPALVIRKSTLLNRLLEEMDIKPNQESG